MAKLRFYTDKGYKTKYLVQVRTGKMQGRQGREKTKLPKGIIARVDNSPASQNVRRVESGNFSGEIFGRTNKKVPVSGTARARGYVRQLG